MKGKRDIFAEIVDGFVALREIIQAGTPQPGNVVEDEHSIDLSQTCVVGETIRALHGDAGPDSECRRGQGNSAGNAGRDGDAT